MSEERLQCPTCETWVDPPTYPPYRMLLIWVSQLWLLSLLAYFILAPTAWEVAVCVKQYVNPNQSGCYAPSEPWLAIGWILYAAGILLFALMIRKSITDGLRQRDKWWPKVRDRMKVVTDPRPWYLR